VVGVDPVISARVRNLKNKKSRLFKVWKRTLTEVSSHRLKKVSNELSREIKKLRQAKINKGISGTPKDFWNTVNETLGKGTSDLVKLRLGDVITNNPRTIANCLSDHFYEKVDNLAKSSNCEHVILPDVNDCMVLEEDYFSRQEVIKALHSLKNNRAMGFDEIPSCVLKDLREVIIDPLCWLFNCNDHDG